MSYRQLTSEERYTLGRLHRQGRTQADIARTLGRHPSTICRELQRNRTRHDGFYRPTNAGMYARGRQSKSRRNLRIDSAAWEAVIFLLKFKWSPEQIASTLRQADIVRISHETIYQRIWADKKAGGDLYIHLRGSPKKRRKRYKSNDSRGRLGGKTHISKRPEHINRRQELGHWEIDTVHGSSSHCILKLVERATGLTLIGKLNDHTTASTNRRLNMLIARAPQMFKSITADNGTEFHGYAKIEKKWDIKFYFCTPYHSWERGTNENTNGLIRQYLPKRTSVQSWTQQRCDQIARLLKSRP